MPMICYCSEMTDCLRSPCTDEPRQLCALPIEKLKGTMPVRSLDLSKIYDCLGAASAIVIASLIGVNRR